MKQTGSLISSLLLILFLLGCSNPKMAELEAENTQLKEELEMLKKEAEYLAQEMEEQRLKAAEAAAMARAAQTEAETQAGRARKALEDCEGK